jgi:hypothetical protein
MALKYEENIFATGPLFIYTPALRVTEALNVQV